MKLQKNTIIIHYGEPNLITHSPGDHDVGPSNVRIAVIYNDISAISNWLVISEEEFEVVSGCVAL